MLCSAIKNNGGSCTQGISTGMTFNLENFVYRVCANHKKTIDSRIVNGAVLSHSMFDPTRRTYYGTHSTVANHDGSNTLRNLATGEETTQLTLDTNKEESTMDTKLIDVTVYWVKEVWKNGTILFLDRATRKVTSFSACAQELVEHDSPTGTIGYVVRNGTNAWKVNLTDASKFSLIQGSFSLRKVGNKDKAPMANVDKPKACGKCSHWNRVDGKNTYVQINHANTEAVRQCYAGETVEAV